MYNQGFGGGYPPVNPMGGMPPVNPMMGGGMPPVQPLGMGMGGGMPPMGMGAQVGGYVTFGSMYNTAPLNCDPSIISWFHQVDMNRSGTICAQELVMALSYGGWQQFSLEAAQEMIRTFSSTGFNQLNLIEFQHLAMFMQQMRFNFQATDLNRNGWLDYMECIRALTLSGFTFDPNLSARIVSRFDRNKTGHITLDEYIELCLFMSTCRDVFNANDYQRTGMVHLSFDHFLNSAVALKFGMRWN